MVGRLVQTARVPARRGHNPEMRDPSVRFEIDIDCVEDNPPPIGRWNCPAEAFQLHHVFEGEGSFGARRRARGGLRQE
jgi:hypothetical protein